MINLISLLLSLYLIKTFLWYWHDFKYLKKVPIISARKTDGPLVSLLIPVRNEEKDIAECLISLEKQTYSNIEIIVINDYSEDRTKEIVQGLQQTHLNITLIDCQEPLANDWLGKNLALHCGSRYAHGKWILFLDADVRLKPECLASTMALTVQKDLDLFSMVEDIRMDSFWEKIALPALLELSRSRLSFQKIVDDTSKTGVACGTYLLFKKEVYQAIGGHQSVKNKLLEDFAFGRITKEQGFKTAFYDGQDLISARQYAGFKEIWDGWTKNCFGIVDLSISRLLQAMLYIFLTSLLPILLPVIAFTQLNPLLWDRVLLSILPLVIVLIYKAIMNIGFRINPIYSPLTILCGGFMAMAIQINILWKIFITQEGIKVGNRIYPKKFFAKER